MRWRWWGVLLLALLIPLSGCQGAIPQRKSNGNTTDATEQPTHHVVRVLAPRVDSVLNAQVAAFYETHPDYQINLEPMSSAVASPLDAIAGLIRDQKVDVVYVPQIEEMVRKNLLSDLTPVLQKSALDLAPYGSLLTNMYVQGKLYDLPVLLQPEVLAYNRDLVTQAHVSVPSGPWTWDELRLAAQQAKRGEGSAKVWGFAPSLAEDTAATWLAQKTGHDAASAAAADLQAAITFFQTMIEDASMPVPGRRKWDSGSLSLPVDLLLTGRAAFGVTDLANITGNSTTRQRYGLAYMPAPGSGKPVAMSSARTFGIAATAPNPDGAWEFLRFIAGPQGAEIEAKQGALPAYLTPAVKHAWQEQQPAAPVGSDMLFETQWVLQPRIAAQRGRRTALNELINRTLSGAEAADTAVATYLQQMAQGKQAP